MWLMGLMIETIIAERIARSSGQDVSPPNGHRTVTRRRDCCLTRRPDTLDPANTAVGRSRHARAVPQN
jgi:hypothetical protein